MAWTTPASYVAANVLGAANLNTYLRDNTTFLLNGKAVYSNAVIATLSSTSTSFVDVSATHAQFSMNITSGRAAVMFFFHPYLSFSSAGTGNYGIFRVMCDATAAAASAYWQNTAFQQVAAVGVFTSLSVGTHTFKMQWQLVTGTGTGYTMNLSNTTANWLIGWEF
jgi:hypothetical protein